MFNILPAVLVGGPPHAGKSVLFYRLTQALRARGVDHYALRACPDGEGNWFHEVDSSLLSTIYTKQTGAWPASFVEHTAHELEYRCLPFLVDMGGRPQSSDARLFRFCTHSLLLLRTDMPEATQIWQSFVEEHNLLPLARIFSQRTEETAIMARTPLLEGILTGLEREAATENAGAGPLFDELLARIATLFTSYHNLNQKQVYLNHAPTELTLDIQQELRTFTSSTSWEPTMLAHLLKRLPAATPLSVYGIGPGWLYVALAAHGDPQPFYLFDPKLPFGWVQPVCVQIQQEPTQFPDMHIEQKHTSTCTTLTISFPHKRLAYFQPDFLSFPAVSQERGLIIDGPIPNWLGTALVRLYKAAGVAWIALFYPPLNQAIVVYSYTALLQPGDLVLR